MKNQKDTAIHYFLRVALVLCVWGCASALQAVEKPAVEGDEVTLEGVILDHLTRKGLSGVTLELLANDESVEKRRLNDEGEFALAFNYEKAAAYKLQATKEGFLTESIDLSLALQRGKMPERMEVSLGEQDLSFTFKGNVLDRDSGEPIPNTMVLVMNTRSGEVTELESDYSGAYSFRVVSGYEYDLVVDNRDYLKRYAHINYCSDALEDNQQYCFFGFTGATLDPAGGVTAGNVLMDKVEIGKTFAVKNIYYDYNKATLREDALPNLSKLVHILADNPQLVVELGSHADSRGSDQYNLKLSQQRAESAVNYITAQGTVPKRITAKGYGESRLLNECGNGVKCSDSAHERNRRTEFTIIDIDQSVFE